MKKVFFAAALVFSSVAFADSYQVTFGWTDPTTYLPGETPVYEAKYRIAGGAEVSVPGLTVPGGTVSVTATPGNTIEVTGRQCVEALCSDWMPWATATAQHPPTQPQQGTGLTITVVRTGP